MIDRSLLPAARLLGMVIADFVADADLSAKG
jgi:hypothetical protein